MVSGFHRGSWNVSPSDKGETTVQRKLWFLYKSAASSQVFGRPLPPDDRPSALSVERCGSCPVITSPATPPPINPTRLPMLPEDILCSPHNEMLLSPLLPLFFTERTTDCVSPQSTPLSLRLYPGPTQEPVFVLLDTLLTQLCPTLYRT